MRKLIVLLSILAITLTSFSQHSENVWGIQLVTGAPPSTISVPVTGDITLVRVYGTGAPTSDVVIVAAGTPAYPLTIEGIYYANITNSAGVSFFGVKIPNAMLDDTVYMRSTYLSSGWKTTIHPNMGAIGAINIWTIDTTGVTDPFEINSGTGLGIVDGGITLTKLESVASGKIIVGSAANVPTAVTPSGDILIDNVGATTLQADAVTTLTIVDKAVTVGKMEDLAQGSVLVGGAGDRPVELDLSASGKIPIGNGTTIAPVTVSGDITLSAAGTSTIQANAITGAEITDGAVALTKIENITSGQLIVGSAASIPTARTITGDITLGATGSTTVAAGAIDNSHLSGGITPDKFILDQTQSTGRYMGLAGSYVVTSAALKSLLTGGPVTLFTLNGGDIITGVKVSVKTGSGVATTLDIGYWHATDASYQDANGLITAVDINATAFYTTEDGASDGAGMETGWFFNDPTGTGSLPIIVTSSVDASATVFDGTIIIYYIMNNGYAGAP